MISSICTRNRDASAPIHRGDAHAPYPTVLYHTTNEGSRIQMITPAPRLPRAHSLQAQTCAERLRWNTQGG